MRLAVCVKHAVDETELRIDPSGKPLIEGSACKMSTIDKNAVEEAVRMKTAHGGDITIFTVGSADAKKTVKEALAMGADRAVHVVSEPGTVDSLGTARILASAIERSGGFDVVLCAEGSSDTYTGQVPPMMAQLLSLPYLGLVRKLEVKGQAIVAEQALEEVVRSLECTTPCVVSVVSEINEPRYPTLIQIMQASKKPMVELALSALGPAGFSGGNVGVVSMSGKAMDRKRVMIEGSPEEAARKLVDCLSSEGVIPR